MHVGVHCFYFYFSLLFPHPLPSKAVWGWIVDGWFCWHAFPSPQQFESLATHSSGDIVLSGIHSLFALHTCTHLHHTHATPGCCVLVTCVPLPVHGRKDLCVFASADTLCPTAARACTFWNNLLPCHPLGSGSLNSIYLQSLPVSMYPSHCPYPKGGPGMAWRQGDDGLPLLLYLDRCWQHTHRYGLPACLPVHTTVPSPTPTDHWCGHVWHLPTRHCG